jgi:hypothetical protein
VRQLFQAQQRTLGRHTSDGAAASGPMSFKVVHPKCRHVAFDPRGTNPPAGRFGGEGARCGVSSVENHLVERTATAQCDYISIRAFTESRQRQRGGSYRVSAKGPTVYGAAPDYLSVRIDSTRLGDGWVDRKGILSGPTANIRGSLASGRLIILGEPPMQGL